MSDNSSENSAVKSDGGGDVTAKYSRLAAEYSKVLRTPLTIIMKFILPQNCKMWFTGSCPKHSFEESYR